MVVPAQFFHMGVPTHFSTLRYFEGTGVPAHFFYIWLLMVGGYQHSLLIFGTSTLFHMPVSVSSAIAPMAYSVAPRGLQRLLYGFVSLTNAWLLHMVSLLWYLGLVPCGSRLVTKHLCFVTFDRHSSDSKHLL